MNKKWSLLIFSMLLVFMLSGCTAPSAPTTASVQPSAASPAPLPSSTAKNTISTLPSFEIEGLHNGDVIGQDELDLQVVLSNFTLVDRNTAQTANAHQGHIHYWLDTNPTDPSSAIQIDQNPEHIVLSKLKAGQHILTIKLVGTDHQPITETSTQILTFLVKRSDDSSTTKDADSTQGSTLTNDSNSTPKPKETLDPITSSATPHAMTMSNANDADAKIASLAIIGIKNGEVITTQDLKFAIDVQHLNLVNYDEHTEAKAGEGHIHIWLDTTSTEPKAAMKVYNDPKHIVIKDIAEGEHTIIVGLVSNDHQKIIGDRQAITFSVKRS